jgi:hypothetical protein
MGDANSIVTHDPDVRDYIEGNPEKGIKKSHGFGIDIIRCKDMKELDRLRNRHRGIRSVRVVKTQDVTSEKVEFK